jgi:hypothetical protein
MVPLNWLGTLYRLIRLFFSGARASVLGIFRNKILSYDSFLNPDFFRDHFTTSSATASNSCNQS